MILKWGRKKGVKAKVLKTNTWYVWVYFPQWIISNENSDNILLNEANAVYYNINIDKKYAQQLILKIISVNFFKNSITLRKNRL